MKHKSLLHHALVGIFVVLCFDACKVVSTPHDTKTLSLMTWNTQNLFDDHADGGEYPEFVPGGESGWNRDAYRARLSRAAAVIRDGAGLPDMVVLEEIETPKVIEDLYTDFLPAGSYPIRMVQADEGSIHVALLSRIPIAVSRSHRIWMNGSSARSVWELHAVPESGPGLIILANHWKSKSGGEAETEALRILAARVIRDRAAVLRQENPTEDIVVCGDLNEVIHETIQAPETQSKSRRLGSINSSQKSLAKKETLVALGRWPENGVPKDGLYRAGLWVSAVSDVAQPECWISPWTVGNTDDQGISGSYFWQGEWEAIDHFLLSTTLFDTTGWTYSAFHVINKPNMLDDSGAPLRYDTRSGKGVSDHLPLVLNLTVAGN